MTSGKAPSSADLPAGVLLERQSAWLAPARSYLLRRVGIAGRQRVLDLGAGRGAVTPELVRRAPGQVLALDRNTAALREVTHEAERVTGDARHLPLATGSLDLVFSQLTLLWVQPLATVLDEIGRILKTGGGLVALEPDYGGLMEYPAEAATREIWLEALARAGADPLVGRKLPGMLEARGFRITVELQNRLTPPTEARFDLLRGLPLRPNEESKLRRIETLASESEGQWGVVAHLPFFFVRAVKIGN